MAYYALLIVVAIALWLPLGHEQTWKRRDWRYLKYIRGLVRHQNRQRSLAAEHVRRKIVQDPDHLQAA